MKLACYNMIRCFTIAYECPEVRLENIHKMIGDFGVLLATFDNSIQYGLFTDSEKLNIAIQLERIEEGIKKWRNATRSPKSQEQQEVTDNAELAVSNDQVKGSATIIYSINIKALKYRLSGMA